MFIGNATKYYANVPFRVKMVLLVLAGLEHGVLPAGDVSGGRGVGSGRPPATARAAGLLSIALWCGVIGFGRWIGFVA